MVIFRTADGQPGYHQAEELTDAVQFVERLRNSEGVEHTRIFRMEEVEFDFKPYYKVEVPTGAPAPVAVPAFDSPADEAAAPEAPAFEVPAFEAPAFEAPAPPPAFEAPTFDSVPPAPEVSEVPVAEVAPVAPLGSPFSAAPADLTTPPEAPSWPAEPAPAVAEVPPPPPPPISVPDPIPEPALGLGDPGLGDAVPPPPPPPEPLEAHAPEGDPVASGSNGMGARRGLFGR
jgi:hypothetical protein